jgi:hypothetical protein
MADTLRGIYKDMIKESDKKTSNQRIKLFKDRVKKAYSVNKRDIVVVDPITLQPIITKKSLPSEGAYKKLNMAILKIESLVKKSSSAPKLFNKKVCSPGKVRSILTGKCIKEKPKKVCPKGKIMNPLTGRCVKTKTSSKKVKAVK